MKKLVVANLFVLMLLNVQAQFVPVPQTFNTPMGPIHTTHYVYMPQHYYNGSYNPKYKFKALLNNDSLVSFKSRISVEKKKMYVEYKVKKEWIKIFPSDTKNLTGLNDLDIEMTGIPVDSCWLFLSKAGPIKCYSSVPSMEMSSAIAIQKGNEGEIISLTKEHLRDMISDVTDEKLSKWLEKGQLVKVIERYNNIKLGIKK